MESTIALEEAVDWREKLRTFHLAGRGLADDRGLMWPAVADKLRELRPLDSKYPLRVTAEQLVGFSAEALPVLHAAALRSARGSARERLLQRLSASRDRLRDLLATDAKHSQATAPEVIAASLGAEGGVFFDAGALSQALSRPSSGPRKMPAERRSRIETALRTLDRALDAAAGEPAFWLFHSGEPPAGVESLGGRCQKSKDCFAEALQFTDETLADWSDVLRALRIAALESDSAFDPSVHSAALDRFDWQSATADEIAALPPVVVLETAERLSELTLASFGRLLRSGRPVQVLVPCYSIVAGALSGSLPDLGYLAMAHREAFVLQGSLAEPDHLTPGLAEMATSLRPAVAVVHVPPAGETGERAWIKSSLLTLSRAFPLYRYNPELGETWSERFTLLNVGPGEVQVSGKTAAGDVVEKLEVLSPIHAAAFSNGLGDHFRVIPMEAWNDEQMDLGEYLEKYTSRAPRAIPFLWVRDEQGAFARAIVTREMVNLCRDRARAWRVFEELAGLRNAYVEAAVTKVRQELEQQISQQTQAAKDQERAIIDQARLAGATEAIARLMGLATGAEGPVQLSAAMTAPPPAVSVPPKAEPAAAVAETAAPPEGPYIDSFLCTSCNDCFKINSRLFAYDANKQAYIADASAGTFSELVKAAEACPAKAIHPGAPRSGDKSATPAMIARGAKYR